MNDPPPLFDETAAGGTAEDFQGVSELQARTAERSKQRAALELGADDVAVTTVANLRWTKDYPTLLRAAVSVTAKHPHVRFLDEGRSHGP